MQRGWAAAKNERRLLAVINNVLNFAKIEAGRLPLAVERVEVARVPAAVDAVVAPQVRLKALHYTLHLCDPEVADAERVQQTLVNLLANAVNFTAPGGRIHLECVPGDGGADVITIRVHDTGRGIPADKLESIFEPFVQVDTSLTREHEGAGLGLSISRALARGRGGELTVESQEGVGSTFTLTLPRAPGQRSTAVARQHDEDRDFGADARAGVQGDGRGDAAGD